MLAALQSTELIATIAVSLCAALGLGVLARKLRLSPIVGYMLAGIAVGPHTPGFVADQQLAEQLAEIGIALLMFGVGLHFSIRDLLAVRRVAVPGAIGQSALATVFGIGVAYAAGWDLVAGLVFGLALSVASTVVLVRGLADRNALQSLHGHVAVGWLVVEDLFTVLILVALPALGPDGGGSLVASLGLTVVKVLGLAALYLVGVRVVPWFLLQVAKLRSRELFTLAVLGIALGIAYGSAVLLSVSMALGAFLGGMIVGQSELHHQAAADALPMRDAFAVLFFVSVGILFDPGFVVERPLLVLATLAIVLAVKPAAALVITLWLGYPVRTGTIVAAGLAQIGEFSFIVGALGLKLGILPPDAAQAIVASALLSIAVNPLWFAAALPLEAWLRRRSRLARWLAARLGALAVPPTGGEAPPLAGHAVLVGYGRTGQRPRAAPARARLAAARHRAGSFDRAAPAPRRRACDPGRRRQRVRHRTGVAPDGARPARDAARPAGDARDRRARARGGAGARSRRAGPRRERTAAPRPARPRSRPCSAGSSWRSRWRGTRCSASA